MTMLRLIQKVGEKPRVETLDGELVQGVVDAKVHINLEQSRLTLEFCEFEAEVEEEVSNV